MLNLCNLCNEPIEHDDRIVMAIEGVYKQIKSVNTFALGKDDLTYLTETMVHRDCKGKFNGF